MIVLILFDKAKIDKQSLDIIAGSIVDIKKEMIGESFSIKNNKDLASCGSSVSKFIKLFNSKKENYFV